MGSQDLCTTANSGVRIEAQSLDMDAFTKVLARSLDLPVVNQTKLAGAYTFQLHWSSEKVKVTDEPSIFDALQEQMGLRLRSQKTPLEVLAIDRAERPSDN